MSGTTNLLADLVSLVTLTCLCWTIKVSLVSVEKIGIGHSD